MLFKKKIFDDSTRYETPFQLAWTRMKKNGPAMLGLMVIILSMMVAILGYLITPDSSPNANTMVPEVALLGPGSGQKFLLVKKENNPERKSLFQRMISGQEPAYNAIPILDYRFEKNRMIVETYRGEGVKAKEVTYDVRTVVNATADTTTVISTTACEALQNEITDHQIIYRRFLLGTDTYGRDILSRLLIGVRISLTVGFMAVIISLFIGTILGSLAGYYQGRADDLIMLLINIVWAIPTLLLVFAITLVLGKGLWQIFVAVGLTMWVQVARIVRGQVMSIRSMEYVEAAQGLGYRTTRIIFRHVLPNTIGPVTVVAASNFATAILIEAGLSFLGIGVQPPVPSWGSMIKDNYGFIISSNAVLAIAPGIAIMIMVLAFNLLGNGLRDALDVRTKIVA